MKLSIPGAEAELLALLYLEACQLELQALKPGNVGVHAAGHGMTADDFVRSAATSAPFLCDRSLELGERIFRAVAATRQAVGCNTNLGIILLAAPLLTAAEQTGDGESLRTALERVLKGSTVRDANWTYQAIRLASPGGLGRSSDQDVADTPTVTLRAAMALAAPRDRIAQQYVQNYVDVFDLAIPRYHTALARWGDETWAATAAYLEVLKSFPDSHLERKFGSRHHAKVAATAAELDDALWGACHPNDVIDRFLEVDAAFKACDINPGTSADLTVACLLTARLEALLQNRQPA
ncbi:MAG: triphosphoribosyl-dephospho-CoA synthase [Methylotetracoccus sp.]